MLGDQNSDDMVDRIYARLAAINRVLIAIIIPLTLAHLAWKAVPSIIARICQ
jgi:hypothetical protein